MGTHPIFESDFDCLTDFCLLGRKLVMDPERVSPAGSGPTGIQPVPPTSHFPPQRDVPLSGTVPLGGTARSEVPSSRSSMVDSASEMSESDTDAMSLSGFSDSNRQSSRQRLLVEELTTRAATLTQENRVLKVEVEKFRIQVASLM